RLGGITGIACCLIWGWTASRSGAQDKESAAKAKESAPQEPAASPPSTNSAPAKKEPTAAPAEKPPPGYDHRGQDTAAAPVAKPPPPPPADLVPCQVQIRVGFGTDPYLTATEKQAFLTDLADHAKRWIGDMWQVEIVPEPQLSPGASFLLERLSLAEFQERF